MYTTLHHIATHGLPTRAGLIHASPLREEVPDLTHGKGMRLKNQSCHGPLQADPTQLQKSIFPEKGRRLRSSLRE
jgi:hypothetical protein